MKQRKRTFIIAEAGINHNGSLAIAKKLVDKAAECNADAVKFQTFHSEHLLIETLEKVPYQIKNMGTTESQFDMLKKLELRRQDFKTLLDYCHTKNILFLSTPYDEESVNLLNDIGVTLFKIPSGEIVNFPLIEHIANTHKGIILSTGMSYLSEVKKAVHVIQRAWKSLKTKPELILLHCVSNYPASFKGTNLNAMQTLKSTFKLPVGFSDHSPGIECAIAAVALGAKVIEKHFTLDKNMTGPDHKASLDVQELKEMVRSIRNVEKALGNGEKKPMPEEAPARQMMRRSLVAARHIKSHEIIQRNDIAIKRPGHGLSPENITFFIGKIANKDIPKDTFFDKTHIKDV